MLTSKLRPNEIAMRGDPLSALPSFEEFEPPSGSETQSEELQPDELPGLPDFEEADDDPAARWQDRDPDGGLPEFSEVDEYQLPDFKSEAAAGVPHWSTSPWPGQLHRPGELALKNPQAMKHRADPYYSEMFQFGSQLAWATIEQTRRKAENTVFRTPEPVMDKDAAKRFVAGGDSRSQRMALLSILDSWGAVTAEQLVAITGHRSLLDPGSKQIMSLFSSGLLDTGRTMNSWERVTNSPRQAVYRHRAPRGSIRKVAGVDWTSAEYLQVDGGVNFQPPPGHMDKHNIFALEFALRCAESHADTSMIFGEKWSSGDSFLPKTRRKVGFHRKSEQYPVRGDGTIVLRNGLRVVIEVTNYSNSSIQRKLQRWARLFAQHSLAESGLVVVFLTVTPARDLRRRALDSATNELRTQIRSAIRRYSGSGPNSPAARIGLMKWTDLFPGPHRVSEQFENLAAEFETTGWEPKPLIEIDPGFKDSAMTEAPLRYGPTLAATPHWWRRGDHTAMVSLPSQQMGVAPLDSRRHLVNPKAGPDPGRDMVVHPPRRLRVIGAHRPLHTADDAQADPGSDADDESAEPDDPDVD